MSITAEDRVSEAPWNGSAGRFSDEQWQACCALDRKSCGGEWTSKPPKSRCSLPYKEPGGQISRAGTHAAAARISQVTGACEASMSSAKAKLRSAYKSLGEDPPSSIGGDSTKSDELDALAREFGVVPGQPRHHETAMRWTPADEEFESLTVRDAADGERKDGYLATLEGHFAVFNRWTEINSLFEGRFLEQIAPGAFKKTFSENRKGMKVLFQHGRDSQVGMKPLGPIRELEEDGTGARYEVPMFDTSYNRDLLPGLKDGQFGASFRFQVLREEVDSDPGRSKDNPDGIEERTIKECRVREFGPVTFPAYEDATAGVRSLTDWWLDLDLELFARSHPGVYPNRLATILTSLRDSNRDLPESEELETQELRESADEVSEEQEAAARSVAPSSKRRVPRALPSGPQRLTGAARKPLRTSRKMEEPKWKL